MSLQLRTIALCLILGFISGTAHSESLKEITAHRGLDGAYSSKSLRNISAMHRDASRLGGIEIWVTFDMVFQGNPDLRTQEDIDSEAQIKSWLISQVIQPVVGDGEAALLDVPAGLAQAPGCRVLVTADGLERIARHPDVKHLNYARISP